MFNRDISKTGLNFSKHFLAKRLRRVPIDVLKPFLSKWKDTKLIKSQKEIISHIILQLDIMQNNLQFLSEFKSFLRDYVLCARESEYLLQTSNKFAVMNWLKALKNKGFSGRKYDFIFHNSIEFEEKILDEYEKDNTNPVSFPTNLILLIAKAKNPIIVSNGLEPLNYFPTSEFEIIFRNDMNLIEVRGEFQVIRDFVNTAIDNKENPLSEAQSIFVGNRNEERKNISLLKPATFINIETLRNTINGSYLSLSSAVAGVKTSRITFEFEGLSNINEETDMSLRGMVEKSIKDPDKTKIQFIYNGKSYSFAITKSGGLTFMKYTPEDVITYIFKKLRDIVRS